jgi:hypothetical protein
MGTKIPEALQGIPNFPHEIRWHEAEFPPHSLDPEWMPHVGAWGWTVIGHDYHYDRREAELAALRDYRIGAFYLWGAEATRWDVLRTLVSAYQQDRGGRFKYRAAVRFQGAQAR